MIKEIVNKAYNFSKKSHKGQKKKFSNLPYFTHPKGVARIAEAMTHNENIVAAALLHDVLEDCDVTFEQLSKKFGVTIAGLVREVTNDKSECKRLGKAQYLSDKINRMSADALTLKLCDRLHNVMHLENDCVTKEFAEKYVKETSFILTRLSAARIFDRKEQILSDAIMAHVQIMAIKHNIQI